MALAEGPDRTARRLLGGALRLALLAGGAVVGYLVISAGAAHADDGSAGIRIGGSAGIHVGSSADVRVDRTASVRVGGSGGVRIDETASIRADVSSSERHVESSGRHADRKRDRQAEGSANGRAAGVARTTGSARPVHRGTPECGRTVQGERREGGASRVVGKVRVLRADRRLRPVTAPAAHTLVPVTAGLTGALGPITGPVSPVLEPVARIVAQVPALPPTRVLQPALTAPVLRPVLTAPVLRPVLTTPPISGPQGGGPLPGPAVMPDRYSPPGHVTAVPGPTGHAAGPAAGSPHAARPAIIAAEHYPASALRSQPVPAIRRRGATARTARTAPTPAPRRVPANLGRMSSCATAGTDPAPRAWATTPDAWLRPPGSAATSTLDAVHRQGRRPTYVPPPG